MRISELPPWQSVQPKRTAGEVCMVSLSVFVWQLRHPADFRSASSWVCMSRSCAGWPMAGRTKRPDAVTITSTAAARAASLIADSRTAILSFLHNGPALELEAQPGKSRQQRFGVVNLLVARAWNQRVDAGRQDDVLRKRWAIINARSEIHPDTAANGRLKQHQLQWLGMVELQVTGIYKATQLGGQVCVHTHVVKAYARIYEIRLALDLAGTQVGYKTRRCNQGHAGAGQRNTLAIPKAEVGAGEMLVIED